MRVETIRGQLEPSIRDEVLELSALSFPDEAVERTRIAWDWVFATPHATEDNPIATVLLRRGDALVGCAILQPFQTKLKSDVHMSFAPVMLNVHPKARGAGLMIMKQYMQWDRCAGIPNNDNHKSIYDRYGTAHQTKIDNLFYVAKPGLIAAKKLGLPVGLAAPIDLVAKQINRLRLPKAAPGLKSLQVEAFDPAHDEIWARYTKDYDLIYLRRHDVLNWRFRDIPFGDYKIWLAVHETRDVVGYVVTRETRENGKHQLQITDLFCKRKDEDIFNFLCRTALTQGLNCGAETVVAMSTSACWSTQFYKNVGLRRPRPMGNLMVNYAMFGHEDWIEDTIGDFYLTRGDTDADY